MASIDEALAIIKRGIDELIPEEDLVEKLTQNFPQAWDYNPTTVMEAPLLKAF